MVMARLLAFFVALLGFLGCDAFSASSAFSVKGRSGVQMQAERINNKIELTSPKVVNTIELTGAKLVMCRCWQSGTFPLCDASHVKHNAATGDNVGPAIITAPKN